MDLTARSMAAAMSESFGQVIVENRTGGGGLVGTDYVARAAPDGYTLLMYADVNVIAPVGLQEAQPRSDQGLRADHQRDPRHAPDRRPPIGEGEHAEGADRAGEARARQADLRLARHGDAAAPGRGAVQAAGRRPRHPARALPRRRAADRRPGRRAGAARPDRPAADAAAHPGGQAQGVRGDREASARPRCPTCRRSRRPGLPATRPCSGSGRPRRPARRAPIINRLHAEFTKALRNPTVAERLSAAGLEVAPSASPEAYAEFIRAEYARWPAIVKAAGRKRQSAARRTSSSSPPTSSAATATASRAARSRRRTSTPWRAPARASRRASRRTWCASPRAPRS